MPENREGVVLTVPDILRTFHDLPPVRLPVLVTVVLIGEVGVDVADDVLVHLTEPLGERSMHL